MINTASARRLSEFPLRIALVLGFITLVFACALTYVLAPIVADPYVTYVGVDQILNNPLHAGDTANFTFVRCVAQPWFGVEVVPSLVTRQLTNVETLLLYRLDPIYPPTLQPAPCATVLSSVSLPADLPVGMWIFNGDVTTNHIVHFSSTPIEVVP